MTTKYHVVPNSIYQTSDKVTVATNSHVIPNSIYSFVNLKLLTDSFASNTSPGLDTANRCRRPILKITEELQGQRKIQHLVVDCCCNEYFGELSSKINSFSPEISLVNFTVLLNVLVDVELLICAAMLSVRDVSVS